MPVIPRPSLRQDATWALSGATAQAAGQAMMMLALTRLTSVDIVGHYALGLAIATPLNLFADRALRMLQATATDDDFALADYLGFRAILGCLAMVAAVTLVLGWKLENVAAMVVLLVSLGRFVEGMAQTLYGRLHRAGRMRQIGQSQIIRALLSVVLAIVTLAVWRRLDLALIASLWANLLVVMGFDCRLVSRLERTGENPIDAHAHPLQIGRPAAHWWRLLGLALPLGTATFMVALSGSLPRLFLSRLASDRTLGVFAVICYLCFPANLLISSLMQAATPRLAELYRREANADYRALVGRLGVLSLLLAVANGLLIQFGGRQLLQTLFGPEYAAAAPQLGWLAVAAGVGFVANVPATSLTAGRFFRLSLVTCAFSCTVCWLSAWWLIPHYALTGAVLTMMLCSVAHLAAAMVGFLYTERVRSRRFAADESNALAQAA